MSAKLSKCFYWFLFIGILASCNGINTEQSEESRGVDYHIVIEIDGAQDSIPVSLFTYVDDTETVIDSVISRSYLIQGKTEMRGRIIGFPERFRLGIGQKKPIGLFLESGIIKVGGNIDGDFDVKATGTPINDQAEKLSDDLKAFDAPLEDLLNKYFSAEASGEHEAKVYLDKELLRIRKQRKELQKKYILNNLDNIYGPYLISRTYYQDTDLDIVDSLYQLLDPSVLESKYAQTVEQSISRWKPLRIGKIAPDFEQSDLEGNKVHLSDFRGKLLLVDFWAAWCGPCRKENPNIVEAYSKYNNQGFEVLGVSLDSDREKWLRAIENDKLAWYHVSDLKGWNNEVSTSYGIKAIPHSILIDRNGRIIAKNLRGDALQEAIKNNI